jgi:ribonucleotide reductase alpha subunit
MYNNEDQLQELNKEELFLKEHKKLQFKKITSIVKKEYTGKVYDLKVNNTKNYNTAIGFVHNGGKRKGAACVYLDTHHPDILSFLELKDNTGEKERRGHNINIANWIPSLFMERVKNNEMWSLFDPTTCKELNDLFGEEYNKKYLELEEKGLFVKQIPAKTVFHRMMKTLSETGNGWMCFRDSSNIRCNTATGGDVLHSSNLCFTGDTMITVEIDNVVSQVALKTLSDMFKQGYDVKIISYDESTKQFIKDDIVNVGLTSVLEEVIDIELPNGSTIQCTENHLFLTNRGWIKAIELQEDDSLVEY